MTKVKKMVVVFLPCAVYYLIIPTLALSMPIFEHKYPNAENTNLAGLTNSPVSGKSQNEYVFPFYICLYNTVKCTGIIHTHVYFFRFG